MFRRSFLKNTALSGLTVIIGPVRETLSPDSPPVSASPSLNLEEATISELQEKMKSGQLSSVSITRAYLERIAAIDKSGPKLNAVIELNPDAIAIATKMDQERSSGTTRGPLHGIPILIKDNIDSADKMMTTAGSIALLGNIADKDAHIVTRLRESGAVLLGKTNLTEWSNFRSSRSVSGWSSRGGQTRNACVLDRNPSGSSAGSAVAVAASLCAAAIGTETNGSIISPASHNGIVGIKPTVGLLSRSGIIPISSTQDTAGPLTRTVSDAALMLGALAGIDEKDNKTIESKRKIIADYTRFLDKHGLNGKKIGVEKNFLKGHEKVVQLYKDAIELMKKSGAIIIEVEFQKAFNALNYPQYTLFLHEFKEGINQYLSGTKGKMKSLKNLIQFNKENANKAMPYFKQEIFEEAQAKGDVSSKDYRDIIVRLSDVRKMINDFLAKNNLDCLCGVSAGPAGAIDMVNGDYDTGFYFGSPAAASGFPHITVPMGKVHELPVGLSFMASAYTEPILISIAYAYEQASKKRELPRFLTTIIPS